MHLYLIPSLLIPFSNFYTIFTILLRPLLIVCAPSRVHSRPEGLGSARARVDPYRSRHGASDCRVVKGYLAFGPLPLLVSRARPNLRLGLEGWSAYNQRSFYCTASPPCSFPFIFCTLVFQHVLFTLLVLLFNYNMFLGSLFMFVMLCSPFSVGCTIISFSLL
jgi:hypothetical protein